MCQVVNKLGFRLISSIIVIAITLLSMTSFGEEILYEKLTILFPQETVLNIPLFLKLVEANGLDSSGYRYSISGIDYIVYKPYYDQSYVVLVGYVNINGSTRCFMEIDRIYGNSIYNITTILYSEIAALIRVGVISNFDGNFSKLYVSNRSAIEVTGIYNIETLIDWRSVKPRPMFEKYVYADIVEQPLGSYIGTNLPPTATYISPTTSSENTGGVGGTRGVELSESSRAMSTSISENVNYFAIITSLLFAIVLSIATYIFMKRI